jgi:hypothetical protein
MRKSEPKKQIKELKPIKNFGKNCIRIWVLQELQTLISEVGVLISFDKLILLFINEFLLNNNNYHTLILEKILMYSKKNDIKNVILLFIYLIRKVIRKFLWVFQWL